MNRRTIPWCFLFLLLFACAERNVPQPPAPDADERLTLSTPRRDYLLGEPVLFDLAFRNLSTNTIKIMQVFVEEEVPLWIAPEGENFQRCPRESDPVKMDRHALQLRPGDELQYKYRVVDAGDLDLEFELAFPKSGDYRIYAEYPLWLAGAGQTVEITSNAVQVRVKEPVGDDAKVWRQINEPSLLTWLANGKTNKGARKEVPMKMAELLRAYPNTGYASAIRHILSKLAPQLRNELSFEQASLLGEVLKLKNFAPIEADPNDKRLDASWKEPAARDTTFGDILASLSKASGVPLDAPAEFKAKAVDMAAEDTTVRQYMRTFSGFGTWERRGNGYFLVPHKPPEAKKADGDKP